MNRAMSFRLWQTLGQSLVCAAILLGAGCTATGGGGGNDTNVNDNTGGDPTEDRPTVPVITDPSGGVLDITVGIEEEAGALLSFNAGGSTDPDGALNFTWDFGDDSDPVTGAQVSHTYANPGSYTVILTLTDPLGRTITQTFNVVIRSGIPTAAFSYTPIAPQLNPATIDFNASDSSDFRGTIVEYSWDFDDGSVETSDEPTISHEFEDAGDYMVTLTVTDEDGNTGTNDELIEVNQSNRAPTVAISANPDEGEAPLTVVFASTTDDPDDDDLTYDWDFGDGETSDEASPTHEYDAAGEYDVSLTVSDSEFEAAATLTITVEEANLAPAALVSATPLSGLVPLTVTFDPTGTLDEEDGTTDLTYCWCFGDVTCTVCDATTPTEAGLITTTHTYCSEGIFTATLTVYDSMNLPSTAMQVPITVKDVTAINAGVDATVTAGLTLPLVVNATVTDGTTPVTEVYTTNPTVTYVSSDPLVATVNASGVVTGEAAGQATITVTRSVGGGTTGCPASTVTDSVVVTVEEPLEPLAVTLTTSVPVGDSVPPDTVVTLTAAATGGLAPYTYDFNVVSQPVGSTIDTVPGTGGTATITPMVEGTYEVEVVVTDSAVPASTVTSTKVSFIVSSLTTDGILINVNAGTGVADTCAVGQPDPAFDPQGADGPSTITDRNLEVSIDVMGGSGTLTYAWSTLENVGLFTNNSEDEPLATWDVPVVDEVSTVTFQVIVTDVDSGTELIEQQTLMLSPAPQISGVCLNGDTEPCLPAPQTVSLGDLTDGVLPISLYVTDETIITDLVLTVTEDTSNPAGAEVSLCLTSVNYVTEPHPCAITFTDPGTYTFRIRLRDDTCVELGQSGDGAKQRVDTEFTVIVDP